MNNSSAAEMQRDAQLSQTILERVNELAGIGSYRIDLATERIWLSAEMSHMLRAGDGPQEMPLVEYRNRHFLDEDRHQTVKRADATYAKGGNLQLHVHARRGDGELVWIRSSSSVEQDAHGNRFVIGVVQDVTATKRDLDRLSEQAATIVRVSERLQLATDTADVGIFELDLVNDVRVYDDTMLRLYGIRREDFRPDSFGWLERVVPEDRERMAAQLLAIRAGVAEPMHEFRILKPDGSIRCIRSVWRMIRNDAGTPLRIVGVNFDVTDQRMVEQALVASETRFRTLIDNAPVAIGVGRDAHTLYVNKKYRQMYGFAPDAVVEGRPIAEQWSNEAAPTIAAMSRQRTSGVTVPTSYESRGRRIDGTEFPVHCDVQMVELPDGPAAVAFLVDVTERRKAEQRIECLNRLYSMLSAVNVNIVRQRDRDVMLDGACRIAVEKGGFRMAWIGLLDSSGRVQPVARAGLVDGYLEQVDIDLTDPTRSSGPTGTAVRTGSPVTCCDIHLDPTMAPWRDAALARGYRSSGSFPFRVNGRVAGAFTFYADTPDAFEPEEMALLDELAMDIGFALDVCERDAQRASLERQLQGAQKMEAFGQLAGGVAHDFNNILSVILGYAGMMKDEIPPDDPISSDLAEIRTAAERAATLTGQLLAFSRRQVMQPNVHSLNGLVDSTVRMLSRLIGEDIKLVQKPTSLCTNVYVDAGQIEMVLMNLAVNARDAMTDGGTLTLETERVTVEDTADRAPGLSPGEYVTLTVTDTGIGMSPETQVRIFEPFFTTKSVGKGTGLGLATVFGIVNQSGGLITVSSEPGAGASFRVWLPAAGEAREVLTATAVSAAGGGTETILVVEDETSVRRLTTTILGGSGYRVIEAHDGADALRVAEAFEGVIDLVLTDMVMPNMNGEEAAARLKAARPGLRVLYTSGYPDRIDLSALSGSFVAKPFTPNALLTAIRERLNSPPSAPR